MDSTDLSIVVPTRNEAGNVIPLLDGLKQHAPHGTRVLFVDDSTDDVTVPAIKTAIEAFRPALEVWCLHRPEGQRPNGLAGAVALGIEYATSEFVLVMDGDLQHPPSTIPSMVKAARHAELVVASRYCRGGTASGLDSPLRHAVSRLSTWIAKGLFPVALRGVTDPMTGFFLVQRSCVDTSRLQTGGFKILLEILSRHPQLSRTQVPLCFAPRATGTSKGTFAQGMHYLRQLIRLRLSPIKA